jgi:hypothetical protein
MAIAILGQNQSQFFIVPAVNAKERRLDTTRLKSATKFTIVLVTTPD